MATLSQTAVESSIQNLIHEVRGRRGYSRFGLGNAIWRDHPSIMEQFRRNRNRFPDDFAYLLTSQELTNLKSQNATSSLMNKSTETTNLGAHGGRRKPAYAFTEQGAIMAATILNSDEAVAMSIIVVRAFVKMRELASQTAGWFEKLREVEEKLSKRMDGYEGALREVFMELEKLMMPSFPVPEKRHIGFRVAKEKPNG